MKIYLAGVETYHTYFPEQDYIDIPILTTFYHLSKKKELPKYAFSDSLILDSGAFTFFSGKKVDWNEYVDKYIDFINKTNRDLFFELDIYKIIGLKETEMIRSKIELQTGRKSIPVWHIFLGIDYYKKLCEDYDYIAISASGAYDSKWTRTNFDQLRKLVLYAKNKGTKVHGLGYTSTNKLKDIPFYSVDSTSWISGMKFGNIHQFNGRTIKTLKRPDNTIMINPRLRLKNNFNEWIKFQKYANENL